MGFLDNASKLVGKSAAGLERTGRTASINAQLKELSRNRSAVLARLGEALYPLFRLDSSIRHPNEAVFAEIERIDQKIKELNAEKRELELQASIVSPNSKVCHQCGAAIQDGDAFCSSCGTAYMAASQPPRADINCCPSCGSPIEPECQFCTTCGARL